MLQKENQDLLEIESKVTSQLYDCIDKGSNFVFNAGAGAGKTYALIECLKYVCASKEKQLKYHNQKVICITYTNVAANEIKERLGSTDVVLVSTIHERLWDLIKRYQDELVNIHLERIEADISNIIESPFETVWLNGLSDEEMDNFKSFLYENRGDYYKLTGLKSKEFNQEIATLLADHLKGQISNVEKFKRDCSKIIRLIQYERCASLIMEKALGFSEVVYDSRRNRDSLHNMRISHDTLIEYATKIFSKYEELRHLVADRFPYFFIDEYQDTNSSVVKIVNLITTYGTKIKHPVLVGFFGDSAQNIYEQGVGEKVKEYTGNYVAINKLINRRSCNEIIEVANRVRGKDLPQRSLYDDACGGSVKVFHGKELQTDSFIKKSAEELLRLDEQSKEVHCFLLLNQSVADRVGIGNLFEWFKTTAYYKREYGALNTELLSNDVDKLGVVERSLYNVVELVDKLEDENTRLTDIFTTAILNNLNIAQVREIVDSLRKVQGEKLGDILKAIECLKNELRVKLCEKKSLETIDSEIDRIVGIDDFSEESFSNFVKEHLLSDDEDSISKLNQLLEMDIELLRKWFNYVKRYYTDEITYHTFHSTKGLEYDNVVIVFGDEFGRSKAFFSDFFARYGKEESDFDESNYVKARNLLYVVVTRARKNLRILYTGDYDRNKDALTTIFGNMQKWNEEE